MAFRRAFAAATLVAGTAAAQVATFSSGGYGVAVNVPSDTASSGSGPIYLQISAPSGTEWVGIGQGSRMSGANMLVVYAADSSNVTVSPRLGTGHVEPKVNSNAQISVLEGSGITSDGQLIANIRCDTCLSWSGGSMSVTDKSSKWIYAYKSGDAIASTSTDADISQHDENGAFTLDLTSGTGGSSANPFISSSDGSSSSATGSAATASTATSTATAGVSNPLASSNPSTVGSSHTSVGGPDDKLRIAHAIVMPLVFVLLFPFSALTIYLPYHEKVRHIHAPLQIISLLLMIVGLGLGVQLAKQLDELTGYHQNLGYVLVVWMGIIQPALGLGQHLHFRRKGTRSPMGHTHRWMGRFFIILGIVNGGLGLKQSGPIGNKNAPTWSVILYSVVSAVCFILYVVVITGAGRTRRSPANPNSLPGEKPRPRTQEYELHGR